MRFKEFIAFLFPFFTDGPASIKLYSWREGRGVSWGGARGTAGVGTNVDSPIPFFVVFLRPFHHLFCH